MLRPRSLRVSSLIEQPNAAVASTKALRRPRGAPSKVTRLAGALLDS